MVRRASPAVRGPAAVVFGLLVALGVLPALVPLLPGGELLRVGDVAPRTLTAERSAQFESRVLTEAARETADSGVQPVYLAADQDIAASQIALLGELISDVRQIRARDDLVPSEQLEAVNTLSSAEAVSAVGRANLIFLDRTAYDSVTVMTEEALSEIFATGVRNGEELAVVRGYLNGLEDEPDTAPELTVLTELLNGFVISNVEIDAVGTATLRDAARDAVVPVVVSLVVGQVVVNEGDSIEAADIEALRATGLAHEGFDYGDFGAGAMAAAAFGLALGFGAWSIQPFETLATRRLLLVGCSSVGVVLAARFGLPFVLPDTEARFLAYAAPISIAAMLAASVGNFAYGGVVAFASALLVAFSVATMTELPGAAFGGSTEALRLTAAYSAAGFSGAACMASAERIRRVALASVAITGATVGVLLLFWLFSVPRVNEELGWIVLVSTVNGLGSSVAATGLFVLLALVLGIPTRMQLYELAQAEHPILRRLQDEAPGTYHHSLMVGTLAERAAGNIGADPLLARVGAYYHDIGKLRRPDHFIENMLDPAETPHKALAAGESAKIIRSHVTDGIELAKRARLPAAVRDFIPQHHGTRLVTYFYRQASNAEESPDPADYRYPGPRPRTRESAIVMLADSCEAVVRASSDHSTASIDALVNSVLAERLAEGQFDDCDITLRELQFVGTTFKATLRAIYHPRIEYPRPEPEELAAIAGSDPSPSTTGSGPPH